MSCLFNRRSTAGRLSLCNDYKISKRLIFWVVDVSQFHTGTLYVSSEKKILKLKISNLSSMILSRPTTVLHKKQMIFSIGWNKLLIFTPFNFTPNLEMHQTTSLDMLLSRQPNIAKDCCSNCLEIYASAHAHGDSYVNLLSQDGL